MITLSNTGVADPYVMVVILILNVIQYIAMISIPFLLIMIHRSVRRQLSEIEKELHKVNDLSLRNKVDRE